MFENDAKTEKNNRIIYANISREQNAIESQTAETDKWTDTIQI